MKFSVVVPVYNVEKYLKDCIESILMQTFTDFELILVDDGSTDKSGDICDEYMHKYPKITVIHKQNEGLISARRIGFLNAVGDFCVSCDSDDFLEYDALEKINHVIEQCDPDIIIFSGFYFEHEKQRPFVDIPLSQGLVTDKNELYKVFMTTHSINSLAMKAVRRSLIDIERDYSSFYDSSLGEDKLQSAPLLIKANLIYYLPERLYNYRYSSGMMRKYNEKYFEAYKKVNKEITRLLSEAHVQRIEEYSAFNTLIAAYGGTTQYKYKKDFCSIEFAKIADDEDFVKAYNLVKDLNNLKKMSLKQRLILTLLHLKFYGLIKILLKR